MAIDIYREFVLVADDVKKDSQGLVKKFKVSVFDSPVGQGEYNENVTIKDPLALKDEIGILGSRDWDADVEKQILLGEKLAALLLPEYARKLFNGSLNRLQPGQGLRLWLRLADELADIPWEYMYIQTARGERRPSSFLALDPRISIVRHLALAKPADWFEPGDSFNAPKSRRLVVAMASPKPYEDHPLLEDLPDEQKALKEALDKVPGLETHFIPEYKGKQADKITGATLKDIVGVLQEQTDIFHFSGHGDYSGALVMADGNNQSLLVDPDRFAETLQGRNVRLVVLGACETGRREGHNVWFGTAASLLKVGIPAVLAMQFDIYSDLAVEFMGAFYAALVAGRTIDEAVAAGRAAIRMATTGDGKDLRDWGTPVLYMRARGGSVFNPVSDAKAAETARQAVENLIIQELGEVGETGRVAGIVIGVMQSEQVHIKESATEVKGVMIGADVYRMEGGRLVVEQKVGKVTGTLIATKIGVLGGPAQAQPDDKDLITKLEEWYRQSPASNSPAPQGAGASSDKQATPQPDQSSPTLLTPSEAATRLKVTEADVIDAIQAGDLKARKIGSKFTIKQEDLDAFLNG